MACKLCNGLGRVEAGISSGPDKLFEPCINCEPEDYERFWKLDVSDYELVQTLNYFQKKWIEK